jgi:hypothetical protein
MEYATIALALLGFAIGAVFRFSVLLATLILLLLLSIGFAIAYRLSLFDAALAIMGVQIIVQASYFLGLVARAIFTDRRSARMLL